MIHSMFLSFISRLPFGGEGRGGGGGGCAVLIDRMGGEGWWGFTAITKCREKYSSIGIVPKSVLHLCRTFA